ncbi:MAG: cytidine deaminase [Mycoplasma sp.]
MSYAPYSNYPVACILIDDSNKQYYGVNVENVSYGLTICAERNAITTACTNGSYKFKEIHIICGKDSKDFGVPCGACRQVITEFMDDESKVIIWNNIGQTKEYKVSDLMPNSFRKIF